MEPAVETKSPGTLLDRLRVRGFVDLHFALNDNDPVDGTNFYPGYGSSAKREGELAVNLAGIDLSLAPEPVGFHLVFAAAVLTL